MKTTLKLSGQGLLQVKADKCASSYNIDKLDDPMRTVIASINAEFEIAYN